MNEIENIKKLVDRLEKKIRELEKENTALKKAIISACDSLTKQNTDTRDQLALDAPRQNLIAPNFKPPKWKEG
jgi:septal ring factor EnvC (AmiA/AmiB activator)